MSLIVSKFLRGSFFPDLYQTLQHLYTNIYVEYIARNPLYRRGPDDPINCPLFISKIEECLRAQSLLKNN